LLNSIITYYYFQFDHFLLYLGGGNSFAGGKLSDQNITHLLFSIMITTTLPNLRAGRLEIKAFQSGVVTIIKRLGAKIDIGRPKKHLPSLN